MLFIVLFCITTQVAGIVYPRTSPSLCRSETLGKMTNHTWPAAKYIDGFKPWSVDLHRFLMELFLRKQMITAYQVVNPHWFPLKIYQYQVFTTVYNQHIYQYQAYLNSGFLWSPSTFFPCESSHATGAIHEPRLGWCWGRWHVACRWRTSQCLGGWTSRFYKGQFVGLMWVKQCHIMP